MNKGVKITIITTLIFSLIISFALYFGINIFKGKRMIVWPVLNEKELNKTIIGYNREYDENKFQETVKKEINSSLGKQGIEKEEIKYNFYSGKNYINISVKSRGQSKKYSFELIDKYNL